MKRIIILSFLVCSFLLPFVRSTAHAAQASAGCVPVINTVTAFEAVQPQAVGIFGTCFGTSESFNGNSAAFRISVFPSDTSQPSWNACGITDFGDDAITCNIALWTDTEIIFDGFTGAYGQNGWSLAPHDTLRIDVANQQQLLTDPYSAAFAECFPVTVDSNSTNCH